MIPRRWVILLALSSCFLLSALGVGVYLCIRFWPASSPKPWPAVTVEAVYTGANARIVEDSIANPIEQQVNGVEKMRHLSSRCTEDGTYHLTVTFEHGVDLEMAQVLVQNRVNLALPMLPDQVNRNGVTVKKKSPGLCMVLCLASPEGRFDTLYLSNYARIQLKDELSRLPGVNDIVLFGQQDYAVRIWLDSDRLAARDLAANTVVKALEQQNLQVAAGQLNPVAAGKGLELEVKTPLGRLAAVDKLERLVVKTDAAGLEVLLRDVGRIEVGANDPNGEASLDGQPVVALGIYPTPEARPEELDAAVEDLLATFRVGLPPGLAIFKSFDFAPNLQAPARATNPRYLLVDVQLPAGASPERTRRVLATCASLLQGVSGVKHVLTFTRHPFDVAWNRGCVLVRLAPQGKGQPTTEEISQTIRPLLNDEVPAALFRLRDLSRPGAFPRCGYPIDLALYGPELERVTQWAKNLDERLCQRDDLRDVWANADATPQPQFYLDIDRRKAQDLGLTLDEILATLAAFSGSLHRNDRLGTLQVRIMAEPRAGHQVETLRQLRIRSPRGELVPLDALASIRPILAAEVIDHFNGQPMVELTANPAGGISLAEARRLCEALAEELRGKLGLSADYRLAWLQPN